jgi:hypothetical protein
MPGTLVRMCSSTTTPLRISTPVPSRKATLGCTPVARMMRSASIVRVSITRRGPGSMRRLLPCVMTSTPRLSSQRCRMPLPSGVIIERRIWPERPATTDSRAPLPTSDFMHTPATKPAPSITTRAPGTSFAGDLARVVQRPAAQHAGQVGAGQRRRHGR